MPIYIHKESIGNFDSCQNAISGIAKLLYPLWREEKIAGYENYIFHKKEDIAPFLSNTNYQELTNDKFPFLISRVTHMKDSVTNLKELLNANGFEVLGTKIIIKVISASTSIPQNQT